MLYFVETLKNSIDKPNQKLASIFTIFLAKASKIILRPGKQNEYIRKFHFVEDFTCDLLLSVAHYIGDVHIILKNSLK